MKRDPYACMDCGQITTNPSGWCSDCLDDALLLDIERRRDDDGPTAA